MLAGEGGISPTRQANPQHWHKLIKTKLSFSILINSAIINYRIL